MLKDLLCIYTSWLLICSKIIIPQKFRGISTSIYGQSIKVLAENIISLHMFLPQFKHTDILVYSVYRIIKPITINWENFVSIIFKIYKKY